MGMLSDYRALKKQAGAMAKTSDVKGRLAEAQSKMENLNAAFAPRPPGRAAAEGIVGTATLTGMRPTGATVNGAAAYGLDLLVMLPGRPPQPVSRTELIELPYLSRVVPGSTLTIRAMADEPEDLVIIWAS